MSLELLKQNIDREKELISRIAALNTRLTEEDLPDKDKDAINESIDAMASQMNIINRAIPDIIDNISFYKDLAEKPANKDIVNVKYLDKEKKKEISVGVKKKDEKKLLEHLSILNSLFKKTKPATPPGEPGAAAQFESYIRLSNKFFRNTADKLVQGGTFDSLKLDLRKITSPLIINSFVSIMLFSTLISFFAGILAFVIVLVLGVSIGIAFAMLVFFPLATFISFFLYPSSKRKSFEKGINQELPFLTIYMAAIATSGIEPSKIFSILVASKDYPFSTREIKKLTNYINFYGYDLVSALKAVSKSCPSERLSLLFDGIATTITSGGELTAFLSKHSDTLLFDYRLEREKYTHIAETFMNIYISIVIAAPMIMMMLFILISLTGFGTGYLTPMNIGLLAILAISLLNIGFLVFLNMKQPKF